MGAKDGTISPARRRAWHQLAVRAQQHQKGQDILFKGPAKYNFPRRLNESELPALRQYIARHTKLTLEYSVASVGTVQPGYDSANVEQPTPMEHESVASYTMQAWQRGIDEGKIGIYFMTASDDSRLESMQFRGVEFTPDCSDKISPSRDEELRHKLVHTLSRYFTQDNVNSTAFPTIATPEAYNQGSEVAAG